MRGLSLTQPWASLVAIGAKTIETRGWATRYRGRVAIHAAKGMDANARALSFAEPFVSALSDAGVAHLPRGEIIAVAQLVECFRFDEATEGKLRARSARGRLPRHEADFGDYAPGRFGFVLGSVVRLETPIPCRGALGLWPVPIEVVAQIDAQFAERVGGAA